MPSGTFTQKIIGHGSSAMNPPTTGRSAALTQAADQRLVAAGIHAASSWRSGSWRDAALPVLHGGQARHSMLSERA
jgi:hypothetical protein